MIQQFHSLIYTQEKWKHMSIQKNLYTSVHSNIIFFLKDNFFIEVQLIYNILLVSGGQQSESVLYIYIYIYILFQILFHYKLLHDIEYSSLCNTVDPCLSALYIVVCICYSQTPNLSPPTAPTVPFGDHKFVSMSVSLFLFCK